MDELKSFRVYLRRHMKTHPLHDLDDLYKFAFQSEFAGGHLITDEAKHLNYLTEEMLQSQSLPYRGIERIDAKLARIHLDGLHLHLRPMTLHRMALYTAKNHHGNLERFEKRLRIIAQMSDLETFGYFQKMQELHYPIVHHSTEYRKHYQPHYRIINNLMCHVFDWFVAVDKLLKIKPNAVIAVDGLTGSGKSTLAHVMAEVFDANIISMDDFFPENESQAELNRKDYFVHLNRERFIAEVLQKLPTRSFEYQPYDCTTQQYRSLKHIDRDKPTLIEGSYSCAVDFRHYYDDYLILTCSEAVQWRRLKLRDLETSETLLRRWILYEKQHFDALNLKNGNHRVLDTTEILL